MIKARNCITWSNQYVAHRDVKRIRRDANKDMKFGLKTYEECLEDRKWLSGEGVYNAHDLDLDKFGFLNKQS